MRPTSVLVTVAFLAGLSAGHVGLPVTHVFQADNTHAAALAAIEKLHKAEIDATLTQDPGPPVVGIKAMVGA